MNPPEPQPDTPDPSPPADAPTPIEHAHTNPTPASPADDPPQDRDIFGRAPRHHPDWSHRRGEPRVFALLWTVYLMAATLLMFAGSGGIGSMSADGYRPAARSTLILIAVGMAVLWPMVRLSQHHPTRRVLRSCLQDAIVVVVPIQALIWPQRWLARWPFEVVTAVSATLAAWGLLIAAVLAILMTPERGLAGPRRFARSALAMAACVTLFLGGAAVALATEGPRDPSDPLDTRLVRMLSPATAISEITRDRPWTGSPAAVSREHWHAIAITALVGVAALGLAAAVQRLRRPSESNR